MSYRNLSDGRFISVSLAHGNSSYGNEATVRGAESAWVNANSQSLQDVLNRVKPQTSWVRRHETLLLNLIALGIGNAVIVMGHILDGLILKMGWNPTLLRLPASWAQAFSTLHWLGPVLFLSIWVFRWLIGIFLGAPAVWRWLLAMWPSIEFDFGLPHLQIEKVQRQRLASVFVLIIVPIFTSLLYDLIKLVF
jgi:hypothetical protein